jgi:hypothetical protein
VGALFLQAQPGVQDGFAVGVGELLGVRLALGLVVGVPEPEPDPLGEAGEEVGGMGDGQVGFTATVSVIVVEGA